MQWSCCMLGASSGDTGVCQLAATQRHMCPAELAQSTGHLASQAEVLHDHPSHRHVVKNATCPPTCLPFPPIALLLSVTAAGLSQMARIATQPTAYSVTTCCDALWYCLWQLFAATRFGTCEQQIRVIACHFEYQACKAALQINRCGC